MINPEPELPDSVVIETTEGKTRFANPATESGLRSMEFEAETKLVLPPKNPPDAFMPSAPPTSPAIIASTTTDPGEMPLDEREKSWEFHQGASLCAGDFRERKDIVLILL